MDEWGATTMDKLPLQESESVKLKKSLAELKQGLVSTAAILNKHNAGTLWFGVRNDGAVIGLDSNEKTMRDLSHTIAAHIEPKIFPKITEVTIHGRRCIKVEFAGDDTPQNALSKLELIKDGQLLNPAQLFFSHKPLQLRCAVFLSTESSTIIDRHDFDGDILELIEEAQKYVLKNIHIGMRLEGLQRVDVPEIAVEALREAIINAFCHRDYYDPDYIQMAIFKDRVEIRNPGTLYGNLTIDDLRKGNVSQRRNPLLANLFRRIDMVEAWGRGMPLILRYAPDVVFREIGNLFIVAFRRPSFFEPKDAGEAATQETTQEKIIASLRAEPTLTRKLLAQRLDISEGGVKYHLKKLKAAGRIRHVGPTKAGRWDVIEGRPGTSNSIKDGSEDE